MSVSIESKVLTENPLLDEIIYNCRQMCTETVLKDQDEADENETLETLKNGDILVDIAQGKMNFGRFEYSKEIIMLLPNVSETDAYEWSLDNRKIPKELRPQLLEIACDQFVAGYEEYNNYYRMLNGLPNYDPTGEWNGLYVDMTTYTPGMKGLPELSDYKINKNYVPFHELDLSYKETMADDGVLERVYNDDGILAAYNITKRDIRYLLHMGTKSISFYDARAAERFDILYCPESDASEVNRRYRDLLTANKNMALYTVYQEAYKFQSPYYDKFMMIFIVIQTIIDMIVELPEYIIRRDVFDSRTCQYIFESAGVDYFPEIPLKYQIAMVKNLNKLVKFKSTDKCIVDICSIFGCDNITVFKYYILRDRKVTNPVDQEYLNYSKTEIINEEETITVPDNDKNYDLKFIKVPIGESYDNYIRNETHYEDYDAVTNGDRYWLGDKTYEEVEQAIKDTDFTLLKSKYYSTEAVIDIAKRNFTLIYFMNILLYNKIDKAALSVSLPNINTKKKFNIIHVIITLYTLSYVYYGAEDNILGSQSKVLSILGFNFEADLGKIQEYLAQKYPYGTVDWEELGCENFAFPTNGKILTFKQLMEIYTTNKDIYDHVTYEICHPENRDLYYAYRHLYNSLFIMKRYLDEFSPNGDSISGGGSGSGGEGGGNKPEPPDIKDNIVDGWYADRIDYKDVIDGGYANNLSGYENNTKSVDKEKTDEDIVLLDIVIDGGKGDDDTTTEYTPELYPTYTEYLKHRAPELYSFIINIKAITQTDKRQTACVNAIQSIVTYLKDYIDQDIVNLDEVFAGLPSISLDFIVDYINQVIDFFKSFKIYTHDTNIRYLFTDKFENSILVVDWMLLHYIFEKAETIYINDLIDNMIAMMEFKEKAGWIIDKIWIDIETFIKKHFDDYYENERYKDLCKTIKDAKEYVSVFESFERFDEKIFDSIFSLLVSLVLKDHCDIQDKIDQLIFVLHKEEHFDNEQIYEMIFDMLVHLLQRDIYSIRDDVECISRMMVASFKGSGKDYIGGIDSHMELKNPVYTIIDDYFLIRTSSSK